MLALLSVGSTHLPAAESKAKESGPQEVVKNLYAAHDAKKSPFFQSKKRGELDKYFTKDLADLIWNDQVKSKGEVGALDFDPLYAAQDTEITKFAIGEAKIGGGKKSAAPAGEEAVVEVNFKNIGKAQTLTYQIQKTKDGSWKISDIRYPDKRTLRKILSGA